MTNTDTIITESNKHLIKTYAPQPVVMSHGDGAYTWDTDGKKYLDFAVGIAVASLGHAHPAMVKTVTEESQKLMACQASYMTENKLKAAQLLTDNSCFDLVYFSNSGTESVEAALKCARKWAYDNKSTDAHEIIAFRNSFHGRTMGAASVTEKFHTQPFFGPYIPGVKWATFNDIDSVKAQITDQTAAIIVEPVQGEGGLTPAHPKFLRALRALCDEHKICLIFDEVQAGMGRLGTFFAYQSFQCCPDCDEGQANPDHKQPIEPDIACLAKGMGGGFPVGAMVAKQTFGEAIVPGTHGTTYGGNPLACAVAYTVMSTINTPAFLQNVKETGEYFVNGLKDLQRSTNKINDIRGMGLMIGVDTTVDQKQLIRALQNNGLMTTGAGKETLRLTPPLIAEKSHIDEALEILDKTLKQEG